MKQIEAVSKKILSVFTFVALVFAATISIAADAPRQGVFTGLNNHVATGTVTLVEVDGSYVIELAEDFIFDGAPDPKIAFGKDGKFDPATLIEPLSANTGAQSYVVPGTINPADFNEIYIWCEQYSVGLGVAGIK